MDRKVAGVLALVLAVVAVVCVPRLINPGLVGTPSAAPMPAPPEVGTCVVDHPMRWVDCGQPHRGEISARWIAEDPARPVDATPDHCDAMNADYIGVLAATELLGWTVRTLVWDTRVARAPVDQRVGLYGWNACVILAPDGGEYLGTVRDLGGLSGRPDIFGNCQNSYELVPCNEPHGTEVLASIDGIWYDTQTGLGPGDREDVIGDVLSEGCAVVAQELTGTADPTYEGRLRVEVWVQQVGQQQVTYDEVRYATDYGASCQLTAVGGNLTGSVVGLGDAAPPVR